MPEFRLTRPSTQSTRLPRTPRGFPAPAALPALLAAGLFLGLGLAACDFQGGNGEEDRDLALAGLGAKPVLGPDEGIPLAKGPGAILFRTDLEDEAAECWSDRLSTGYARTPCGHWGAIGPSGARLAVGSTSRSGRKALEATFDRNESRAGATLSLSAEVVNVRAWYNFAAGFDFGQGIKVGRIRSFNHAAQANDIDIILVVRSSGDADQCGLTDMADLGLFYNGKPAGRDWGHLIVPVRFERGRWYAVEYQVALNTPGTRDGSVALWVDGRLAGSKKGLDLRGKHGSATRLNKIMVGGWYSNSALTNGCADPSSPSSFYIDDVAVGTDYIGPD